MHIILYNNIYVIVKPPYFFYFKIIALYFYYDFFITSINTKLSNISTKKTNNYHIILKYS